jgi:hypothetical protein
VCEHGIYIQKMPFYFLLFDEENKFLGQLDLFAHFEFICSKNGKFPGIWQKVILILRLNLIEIPKSMKLETHTVYTPLFTSLQLDSR